MKGKTKPVAATTGGVVKGSSGPTSRPQNTTTRALCQELVKQALPIELRGLSAPRASSRFLHALCASALLELWADCEGDEL